MTNVFKLNQKVWFEPDDKREKGYEVIVTTVGRLYYTVARECWKNDKLKFDKETLCRCEYPHGRLYKNEQEAKDYKKSSEMFFKLKSMYGLKPTLEQMKAVYKILEISEDAQD